MSSTRNRNTAGNYKQEQWTFQRQTDYSIHQPFAIPSQVALPGDGLGGCRIRGGSELAGNHNDVESLLFGIGSTNLVTPQSPVQAELRQLPELSIVDRRVPLVLPANFVVQNNQRPYPI
jgi:hypothetical protein